MCPHRRGERGAALRTSGRGPATPHIPVCCRICNRFCMCSCLHQHLRMQLHLHVSNHCASACDFFHIHKKASGMRPSRSSYRLGRIPLGVRHCVPALKEQTQPHKTRRSARVPAQLAQAASPLGVRHRVPAPEMDVSPAHPVGVRQCQQPAQPPGVSSPAGVPPEADGRAQHCSPIGAVSRGGPQLHAGSTKDLLRGLSPGEDPIQLHAG